MLGKFQEVLLLLADVLETKEDRIKRMNDIQFFEYRDYIKKRIFDIERYIEIVEKEKAIVDEL